MKIKCHENTGFIYITTDTVEDMFNLGKLAERLRSKGAVVYGTKDGRELQISKEDLLTHLLQ